MTDDVRSLIEQCLAGRQSAMAALVDRYGGQVFGLCYRMLGHRQDAEDTAQETFVRVLRSLHQWDPQRDFEPWLLAIAGNRCRTVLATRQRRPKAETLVEPVPDHRPGEQAAEHLAEEMHLALLAIRQEYRQAFVLFHEHHLSYAEIAENMDCPLGTIKTWVHRARRELIDRLTERAVVEERSDAVQEIRTTAS